MFVSLHRRFLPLVLLGCMAGGIAPAATVLSPRMDAASGIDIRLESWLDSCPPAGVVPVRIRIRNVEKQAHTWTITSECNTGGASSVDITVEGGQEGERMMYAPVLLHPESSYYNHIAFRVKGPGVADEAAGNLHNSGGYSGSRTEFVGMSTALHAKGWSALENKFNTAHSGTDLQGSKVEISSAPEDWRGYAGLAQMWMDEGDWTSMSATAKAAMMEWVAMGGEVYLLCLDSNDDARLEQLGLPPKVNAKRPFGAGGVYVRSWDGKTLPVDAMAVDIRSGKDDSRRELMSNYVQKWELADIVGPLKIKSGLIFGFIAIFGLLVGPVNLFWLAGAGRRQRLFWTTPLLSLAASGLLLALMVLQDGIGGTGARTIFALMLPEQKRIAVTQEQVAKTGVLLGRGFGRADPDLMAPISINTSSRRSSYDWQSRFNVEESETHRNGAWFASRSLQAHVLQTIRPSRAGIEVFPAAGSAPSVLSTVEVPLQRLFIMDDGGKVWSVDDVGTGEKKTMRASDIAELEQWMRDHSGQTAGPMVKHLLQQVEKTPGFAYAEAADASKFAIATLPSIRWNHERLLLAGPYVKH